MDLKVFHVYILESKHNHSYYVGSCGNLAQRIKAHNSGFVKSTKRYLPWRLVYSEGFEDRNGARRRELEIKRLKKRTAIEHLISNP